MLADGSLVELADNQIQWALKARQKTQHIRQDLTQTLSVADVVMLEQVNDQWILSQNPAVEGALVSLDPHSGAILSLVGGYHFYESNFNRVTQAKRQLGSLFKPFLYSAALDKGFTLASLINDAPVVMHDSGEHELWRPNNVNYRFYGPTSLREALTKSRNIVSVRLLDSIGIAYARRYIHAFGFSGEDEMPSSLSLALGSGVATPMQTALAYTVFANGGTQPRPFLIDHITTQNGQALVIPGSKYSKKEAATAVVTPQNAYLVHHVLQDVISKGTGRRARVLKRADIAGKTGTTNDQKDAWFSGYTPDVVTTVWVGFDNVATLKEYASQLALPIWVAYMRSVAEHFPEHIILQPNGIVNARIDPLTGYLANNDTMGSRFEIFDGQHLPPAAPLMVQVEHNDAPVKINTLFE